MALGIADAATRLRRRWWWSLLAIAAVSALLTATRIEAGSMSEFYAAISLSMSSSWHNFLFGSLDRAGTVSLDKIPGSYWVPAVVVRAFGFSKASVILPNVIASVCASIVTAVTARRLGGILAGVVAGLIVATTPILVAVGRSNQPESFFILSLALVAWAGAHAISKMSLGWFVVTGAMVAVAFQMYMIEAWATWPALVLGYACTRQSWLRRITHTAIAALVSLALSLTWIAVVSLTPPSSRPYIGSTLSNSAWEMVFGYNALGRFNSGETPTRLGPGFRTFTPSWSGGPGPFRLLNEQLAGQSGWLLYTSVLGLIVLTALRYARPITVFLGVWLATFITMFSTVAGMHQFYTAALAIPFALVIGIAYGAARSHRVAWAELGLVLLPAVAALSVSLLYVNLGYPVIVASLQCVAAAIAYLLIRREHLTRHHVVPWTVAASLTAMLLSPAAWSVATLIVGQDRDNPVAGGASASSLNTAVAFVLPSGQVETVMPWEPSTQLAHFLERGRLTHPRAFDVATLDGMRAASVMVAAPHLSVLPVGGFEGLDPVPTAAEFRKLITDGDLRYVLLRGPAAGSSAVNTTQIRRWVVSNCAHVPSMKSGDARLYDCSDD